MSPRNRGPILSRRVLVAWLATLPLTAAACDDDAHADPVPGAGPATYVGTIDGTDMRVGVVVGTTESVVFVCGGAASLPDTHWVRGAGTSQVSLAAGSFSVDVTPQADAAKGTVRPGDGRVLSFSAARVGEGSALGVYETTDQEGRAGVIVTAADALQGAFVRQDGRVAQIVPIRPGPIDFQGESFSVLVETRTITVRRLRLT